jgi:hypothetical protein
MGQKMTFIFTALFLFLCGTSSYITASQTSYEIEVPYKYTVERDYPVKIGTWVSKKGSVTTKNIGSKQKPFWELKLNIEQNSNEKILESKGAGKLELEGDVTFSYGQHTNITIPIYNEPGKESSASYVHTETIRNILKNSLKNPPEQFYFTWCNPSNKSKEAWLFPGFIRLGCPNDKTPMFKKNLKIHCIWPDIIRENNHSQSSAFTNQQKILIGGALLVILASACFAYQRFYKKK